MLLPSSRTLRRFYTALTALATIATVGGSTLSGAFATAAPAPTAGASKDEFSVVHQTDPLVHVIEKKADGLHISECMAGYLFQKGGRFYGLTTVACGPTGTVVSKMGQQGRVERVGVVVGHDPHDSFLSVIRFDDGVRQGNSYHPIPRGLHARPLVNTLDYFGRGAHSLSKPLVLTAPSDDAEGVSTFAFSCEPRFAIPGSPLVVNRKTAIGMYTSVLSTSLPVLGICFGVTSSYLQDFSTQETWVR